MSGTFLRSGAMVVDDSDFNGVIFRWGNEVVERLQHAGISS